MSSLSPRSAGIFPQSFHCEITFDDRDHNAAVRGLERAIDYEQRPIPVAGAVHRIPLSSHDEGRAFGLNQVGVEIERRLEVVSRRRGKPGAHAAGRAGQGSAAAAPGTMDQGYFTRRDCLGRLVLWLSSAQPVWDSAGPRGQARQIPAPTVQKTRRAWGRCQGIACQPPSALILDGLLHRSRSPQTSVAANPRGG